MSAVGNGNTASAALNSAHQAQYCGPYKLEKTLGKGQTGTHSFVFHISAICFEHSARVLKYAT
ncbi:unnamed protein product [Toxocara canis]|uniref:Protein kinase domain-containing protein n=1 Tax=Toxocara canis TaxID=6265 RepID=A0A183U2N9_TOXCA|nr:unnamed protein product [Toxocara canis]